jgi:hypothetical protein
MLSDDECHEIFSRPAVFVTEEDADREGEVPLPEPEPFPEGDVNEDDILQTFFPRHDQPSPYPGSGAPQRPAARREDDLAARYRMILEKAWKEGLARLVEDPRKRRFYGFPQKEFGDLVSELDQGARRLGVMDAVEQRLREAMGYANINPESRIWKISRIASAILSDYVSHLGLSPRGVSREGRTITLQGRVFLLFEPQPQKEGFPELPELSPAYETPYHNDWRLALYKVMIDNVDFKDKNFNEAENSRLGSILRLVRGERNRLRPPAPAGA